MNACAYITVSHDHPKGRDIGAWAKTARNPGTTALPRQTFARAALNHQYGHEFNDHWLDAMMASRSAELALCRAELRAGASQRGVGLAVGEGVGPAVVSWACRAA